MMSSSIIARRCNSVTALVRPFKLQGSTGRGVSMGQRHLSTWSAKGAWDRPVAVAWVLGAGFVTAASIGSSHLFNNDNTTTSLEAMPMGPTEVVDPPLTDTNDNNSKSLVEEPLTGIPFPPTFQSKHLLGLGVRKKFSFVNVYAVAFYANQEDFKGLPQEKYEENLLNPNKHRVIRIVMNRTLTMNTVIAALLESVEPRMQGKDLDALEHFSKLRKYGSLKKGDDVVITIKGESLECNCSNGGYSVIQSEVFTRAICAVYFDKDAISPGAKSSVLAGIRKL